jgi:hypothetical protein
MRKLVLALGSAALLAVPLAGPASAHGPCDDQGRPGASDYGRDHIASHTPAGPPSEAHNPGTHQGYSLCLGVHED